VRYLARMSAATLAKPRLAATIEAVGAPPIPACRAWAARYRGGAGPLLDLTQAVPGYPPHPEFLERLAAAAGSPGVATYGPLEGEAPLRDALAADLRLSHGGDVQPEDVSITAGCNTAFNLAMTAIAAPGDTVLVPTPWFFNHQMALALRGVAAVPLPCRAAQGFLPDPEQARALIGPRVRAIVLVTPNNPTGAVYPPALIARFAQLCRDHGLWLVLDETYRDFIAAPVPGDAPTAPHALFAAADWRDFVVHLYSFSKAYCIPGHRVGAVAAGPAMRDALIKAVDNIQICPPRPPQVALAWGVPALRDWRAANRGMIAERAIAFRRAIGQVPGWQVDAIGAYFAYVRLPPEAPEATLLAEWLAAERGLVALPGSFFAPTGDTSQNRHLRLSFANLDMAGIAAVAGRLSNAG